VINESPIALQLRYLQTLTHISAEKNSTIVFPIPGKRNLIYRIFLFGFVLVELLRLMKSRGERTAETDF
jgi:hypothetical protein